ncbi:MAG: molybdate ABC transporter substrate-binding protein [Woeseiaceae bacterium]
MRLIAILISLLASCAAYATPLTVAVASNFRSTAESLAAEFTAATGHDVRISSASTGALYAQIVHGAPFDIFLAADAERPELLVKKGIGVGHSRMTYAIGTLVLWSGEQGTTECQESLSHLGNARLAIANPETAPYGRAAKEFLQANGYWEAVSPQLVYGENVAQALHFAVTGNARFALVARAQVVDPRLPAATCRWPIPADSYKPVEQQAVLLERAANNPVALRFIAYLRNDESRATIQDSGYGVP